MDKITSSLYTINKVVFEGLRFNIPRYQRLYVWEDEQVETLFNDLHTACIVGKDMYYIGGVILVKNKWDSELFDLVDGQQRFTTLWLMAYELGDLLLDFRNKGKEQRIEFAIRPKVEKYFKELSSNLEFSTELNREFEDLVRIDLARRRLKELIQSKIKSEREKKYFADFIAEKLKFVVTIVPQKTDLNKLFETLNNRGEQLSQDEILKARILAGIQSRPTRWKYSGIWNTCNDTRNYLERALSYEIGSARSIADSYNQWSNVFDTKKIRSLFDKSNNLQSDLLSLEKILAKRKVEDIAEGEVKILAELHPNTTDDELQKVRSILTFPQLLLHTLRIFRYKRGLKDIQRINEKELLKIFDEYFLPKKLPTSQDEWGDFENDCKEFVELLFNIREIFDKYIIKWVEIGQNNEELMIKKVRKQNQKKGGRTYYLRREITEQFSGLTHLQGLLYHSQQNTTQYWLTPYLNWLLEHPSFEDAYDWLKKLDNILFCTNRDEELLTERTWECMTDYPKHPIDYSILVKELGTGFPHYWFYKIDFILWHEKEELRKTQWNSYKVTAKNSIEHIGPQNPRDKRDKVCVEQLDKIGNLVLVTRSINSEYGDQPYKVKRARFIDKKNKGSYDSLKSDLIYGNDTWNDGLAKKHQEKILEVLEKYFDKTKIED
ncbi:DUF262 domain-containing protein [Flavobacterium algicola]|uniref:DUF262 domain-containing protein n=1 Tax=Flavobacterium algicola TaxID=556529 RepID=UPI001EFD6DD3|nr:DUF262 domain-containing protein [Flavobacterium algicola]MCG9792122.1 DUF262 domain-containing HNH endonuclease family protein [Flavobacterium algicola]